MPELTISPEKVGFLIEKARQFDVKEAASDPDSGSNAADDDMIDVLEDDGRDPVVREITGFIDALSEDEQIDLVALMRLGRGDGTIEEWKDLRQQAAEGRKRSHRALSAGRADARRSSRRRARRVRPLLDGGADHAGPVAICSYLAQSTITVPSLSPFSTARCACAVSESANCAATL